VKQKEKTQYRTRNWNEYNTALINRGSIIIHISPQVQEAWNAQSDGLPHKQRVYSDLAIETVLTLKILFHMTLRQSQGFTTDILCFMGLNLPCPHYTTLCRRAKTLTIDLGVRKTNEPIHLLVDSTGLKVFGEGEWKTRKWGADKRRTWLKMHIGVDKRSGQIVGVRLTDSGQQDGEEFAPLLASIEGEIDQVNGDGAYDSYANYALIKERGATALIPARHGAVLCNKPTYGKDKIDPSARNAVVQEMLALWDEETGDALWKEQSGYHARSRVESEMFRYKTVIGDGVRSHDPASQQVEVLLGCKILNHFTALGRCESYAVINASSGIVEEEIGVSVPVDLVK
jgi:hypothetical protein